MENLPQKRDGSDIIVERKPSKGEIEEFLLDQKRIKLAEQNMADAKAIKARQEYLEQVLTSDQLSLDIRAKIEEEVATLQEARKILKESVNALTEEDTVMVAPEEPIRVTFKNS